MLQNNNQNIPSGLSIPLITGRGLMFVLAFMLLGTRFNMPGPQDSQVLGSTLAYITIAYCFAIALLSFFVKFIRSRMYEFTMGAFILFSIGFLFHLHILSFSDNVQTGFLVFSLLTLIFMQSQEHLFIYALCLVAFVVMTYFVTPSATAGTEKFLFLYAGTIAVAVILINSRLSSLKKLSLQDVQYKQVIEHLHEGLMQINNDGEIIYVNDQFSKISGYDEEELVGKSVIPLLILEEDQLDIEHKRQERLAGRSERYETRIVRKDGKLIWIEVSAGPLVNASGTAIGSTSIILDISARKQIEEEVAKYSEELKYFNNELEAKNIELEQFARIASTDLKMPLQAIQDAVDLLPQIRNTPDPLADEYLLKIRERSQQMRDLLDALLLYSLSGAQEMKKEALNVNQVISEVVSTLSTSLEQNKVEVKYENLPLIFADRIQFIRLFRNLIENAIKYRGENNPVIHITCSEDQNHDKYIFSVEDNGIGIDRAEYGKVFQIFQRNSNIDASGLSMGLAICKKIINNHDGRLWFTSNAGKGTTFFFNIPFSDLPLKASNEKERLSTSS